MRRGDLFRVRRPGGGDPRSSRVFAVVSRQALLDSGFSTAICAPVFTRRDGLSTQVDGGLDEGLKHESSIHCDALISVPKIALTDLVGSLSSERQGALDEALGIALAID